MHKTESIASIGLAMFFVALLLTANVIGEKPLLLGSTTIPAGLTLFPLSYLLGGVFTELYGFKRSRQLITIGMLCCLWMAFVFKAVLQLPSNHHWEYNVAYSSVLYRSSRLIGISVMTYMIGELVNALIVSKLKKRMKGKSFWLRSLYGSWVGEALETGLFVPIAFHAMLTRDQIIQLMVIYYGFKLIYAVLMVPVAVQLVRWLRPREEVVGVRSPI